MVKVTYEYHSKGSPVTMFEKVNGYTVAIYTAYIDRHGNGWMLYPKERLSAVYDVPFEKKYVSILRVTILPPLKPTDVPKTPSAKVETPKKPDEQVTLV